MDRGVTVNIVSGHYRGTALEFSENPLNIFLPWITNDAFRIDHYVGEGDQALSNDLRYGIANEFVWEPEMKYPNNITVPKNEWRYVHLFFLYMEEATRNLMLKAIEEGLHKFSDGNLPPWWGEFCKALAEEITENQWTEA